MAGPDLLFRGGTVYDGTGAPGVRADVTVSNGRISAVGADLPAADGARTVDAGGLAIAPGFIDLHSHSDFTFPSFPDSPGQVSQGVTSELVGHCGDTPAPLSTDPARRRQLIDYELAAGPELHWQWTTFGEYLAVLDAARPAVNCLPLVGHTALRVAAMGMTEREPRPAELEAMRAGLREALAAGAWGMSTGLSYAPGQWATRAEIIEVGGPLTEAGALYASHIRNESDELLAAVAEALSIGEALGVPVEVSHLKAAGVRNEGRTHDALGLIAEARARGVRATCDMYPYEAGSTYLNQLLPPWAFEGGVDRMLQRIRSEAVRFAIRRDIEDGVPAWGNLLRAAGGWNRVLVNGTVEPDVTWARGRFVSDIAAEQARDGLDVTCDLLLADRGATTMAIFMMSIADVREVIASPLAGVGSDLYAVTGPGVANHPRCSGSFARILGPWVREGLLPLEEAVRKMTSLPADVVGLRDRGRLAPGLVADLVCFDPETVTDRATWAEPAKLASGIEHVLIGGEFAIEGGRPANLRLGRVIRRTS
ncbi:MAG TPA: D-aminoacylase [Candidatus Saccharimonadales bacterium]|nr:D-aminoacylase [Candidatus Saccharimonadales bacterium]